MKRWLAIVATALLVVGVLANPTFALRKSRRAIAAQLNAADRFVDFGVILRVVVQDDNGEELLEGKPRLRVLREHRRGGIIDRASPRAGFVAPSRDPVVWHCSEEAEHLILHGDDLPLRLLVYGAMGAGKTTTLVMWLGMRHIEFIGSTGMLLLTCPTNDRSQEIRDAVNELWPAEWFTWNEKRMRYTMASGLSVRIKSTHQQSRKAGARVQGMTCLAAASDEIQDSLDSDSDIEARGRGAPRGMFRRLCTATAKDDSSWRAWRDRVMAMADDEVAGRKLWGKFVMSGPSSPFIFADYWLQLRKTMTARDYARKVLGQDVGPERQVYTSWDRAENLRPIPIGVPNVTQTELRHWGGQQLLAGHDPGKLWNVTTLYQAYQYSKTSRPVWFAVGEVSTRQGTTEVHIRELKEYVRKRWGGAEVLVRLDPSSSNGSDEARPDVTIKTQFRNAGFKILDAVYVAQVGGQVKTGRVPKEAGIGMVNTLLCNADNERRLLVACDDRNQPYAPRLVEAFEAMERDGDGRAEAERKDEYDRSHWPATTRYALWVLEKPRYETAQRRAS